jgi:putative nucleotidyltransferase with HDIG domain
MSNRDSRWTDGGGSPPTPEECLRILAAYRVPAHIVEHSLAVARLARRLSLELAAVLSHPPEPARMEAGALLHDIAKKPGTENLNDHALEGGRILRALGMPDIAFLVERHINPGQADLLERLREDEVLSYCDKRVKHKEIVSLDDRFADLLRRYGAIDGVIAVRIGETERIMKQVEKKIFADLPFSPAALESW